MKRFLIIAVCAVLPMSLWAQHFTKKAKVDPVSGTSFYKIKINADVVGYCDNQLQDLRLFDNDGKEIPYLLNKEAVSGQSTAFDTYTFKILNEANKSIVIVENPNKNSIQQFLFEMKNANATRLLRISGSDNKADWFVVRDSFYFESSGDNNSPMIQRSLHFPETDYAFYKVEITNGTNESPLNIIRVGKNSTSYIAGLYQRVNNLRYKIVDSNKSTYICFKTQPGNKIDKLAFAIDAPDMYKRTVIIRKMLYTDGQSYAASASNISQEMRIIDNGTMNAELASNGSSNIDCSSFLGGEKCDSFIVQILNQDDAPLHFKSIEAFQLGTTLTAKMEKGKSYYLYFGDSLLSSPAYDLVYFDKNIPANIASVNVQSVQPKEQQNKDEYNGDKDKWIVWVGLGIAGITILLLTLNMMKKMKHSDS